MSTPTHRLLGKKKSVYYDAWAGFSPNFIEDWYIGECWRDDESGSVSGPHRATVEEAIADTIVLMPGNSDHAPYDHAHVVKHSPALKISIAKVVS